MGQLASVVKLIEAREESHGAAAPPTSAAHEALPDKFT
jgi:hypothetical protein